MGFPSDLPNVVVGFQAAISRFVAEANDDPKPFTWLADPNKSIVAQITTWKAQLQDGASDVFGPGGGNGTAQPAVDVKSLHAKIGESDARE